MINDKLKIYLTHSITNQYAKYSYPLNIYKYNELNLKEYYLIHSKCRKCNTSFLVNDDNIYIFFDACWKELKLTCEEVIIQKIID